MMLERISNHGVEIICMHLTILTFMVGGCVAIVTTARNTVNLLPLDKATKQKAYYWTLYGRV